MDTIVIGLDGAEWRVINDLITKGSLPYIASLREEGVSANLASVDPPLSPPAWNSVYTGKNPGKHGIFDFHSYGEGYRKNLVSSTDRAAVGFWKVLNWNDVSTGLFKLPFTYPPSGVDGFLVTGFPRPSEAEDFAVPEEVRDHIDISEQLLEDWSYQREGQYARFKQNILEIAEKQSRLFSDLVAKHDPEFGMTVYDGCDRLQHFLWKYYDESHNRHTFDSDLSPGIPEYYELVDREIGRLLDRVGDDTNVVLLSDHGFGPLSNDIRIEKWLREQGYLARPERPVRPLHGRAASAVLNGVWSLVEGAGADRIVRSLLPGGVVETASDIKNPDTRNIDWSATRAFFTSLSGQSIYVNREERFQSGIVSEEEYEGFVEELQSSLGDLHDPETDEAVIKNVFHRDEIYHGPQTHRAPDLIVDSKPEYTLNGGEAEELIEPSKQYGHDRSGDHGKRGVFIAKGPAFTTGEVSGLSVIDIAPILLHLHGCPVGNAMDGAVPTEIFADDAAVEYADLASRRESRQREWSEERESELEEQLRDMGYM